MNRPRRLLGKPAASPGMRRVTFHLLLDRSEAADLPLLTNVVAGRSCNVESYVQGCLCSKIEEHRKMFAAALFRAKAHAHFGGGS
jgi:hypothetical protein